MDLIKLYSSLIYVWHVRRISFAENHVLVGELMEAKANVGDNGGAYAAQGNGNLAWLNDADINGATGGYSLGFALTVIQVCIRNQRLLFSWTHCDGCAVLKF